MIETDEEMDPSKCLESDIYPMTAATKLYSLICESVAEAESIPKDLQSESLLVDPTVFTSAFKFLEKYQKKNHNNNNYEVSSLSSYQELSQNNCRTKCLTVFSSPYDRRKPKRLEQQSTELPESVKQMMEKDAALRRLLKTGNVTISLTTKSEDNNDFNSRSSSAQQYNASRQVTNNTCVKNKLLSSDQKYGIGANLLKKLAKKATTSLSSFTNSNGQRKGITTAKTTTTKRNKAKVQNLFLQQTPYHEQLKRIKNVPNLSKSNKFDSDNTNYNNTNKSGAGFRLQNKNSLEKRFLNHSNLLIPSTSSSLALTTFNSNKISKLQLQNGFQRANQFNNESNNNSNSCDEMLNQSGNQVEESKTVLKSTSRNNNVEFDPTTFLEVSFREEDAIENRRKYSCPHCVKKFAWSTDLKRHILTHTGERPFKCEFCSSAFTRKFLMQKHAKKHHPEEFLASTVNVSNQKICKSSQNQAKINPSTSTTTTTTSTIDTTINDSTSSTKAVSNSLMMELYRGNEYDSIRTSTQDNYSTSMFNTEEEEEEETEIDFQHLQQEQFEYEVDDEIQDQFDDLEIDLDFENTSNCDTTNLDTYEEEQEGDASDDNNDDDHEHDEEEERLEQDPCLPRPPPLLYHDLYSRNENINSDSKDSNEKSSNEAGTSSAPIVINVFSSLHQNSGTNNNGMTPGPPPNKRFKKMDSSDVDEEDDVEGFSSINHHHHHHVQRKFSPLTSVQS